MRASYRRICVSITVHYDGRRRTLRTIDHVNDDFCTIAAPLCPNKAGIFPSVPRMRCFDRTTHQYRLCTGSELCTGLSKENLSGRNSPPRTPGADYSRENTAFVKVWNAF